MCSKSDQSKPETQTTPNQSAMKPYNMYDVSKSACDSPGDSSDSDGGDTDSDVSDDGTKETHNQDLHGYRLIDVDILNRYILPQLSCAFCHSKVSLFQVERRGLGCKFAFMCKNKKCDRQQVFPSCPMISEENVSVYSANRHSAFAMRCIGGNLSELKTFCGIMNLPNPVCKSSHNKINQTMKKAAYCVQKQSMDDSAIIKRWLAEDIGDVRDIEISVDGTYMTKGIHKMLAFMPQ